MIIDRKNFAQFIDRLITSQSLENDWNEYAVNHFQDALLEEVRQDLVRLMINGGDSKGQVRPGFIAGIMPELESLKQRLLEVE